MNRNLRTVKEIAAERMQKEPITTDTPRTDAASFSSRDPLELMKTSRQLERELNDLWSRFDKQMEAQAEVERLRSILKDHATFLRKNVFDHQANLLDPK